MHQEFLQRTCITKLLLDIHVYLLLQCGRPFSYTKTLIPNKNVFEDPEVLREGQLDHLDSLSKLRGWLTDHWQESSSKVLQGCKLKLCHPSEDEKMGLRLKFLKITNLPEPHDG